MAWFDKLSKGLSNTRNSFTESMNVLFRRGPKLDENFYDDLEETLILGDMGFQAAEDIVASVRDTARRKALPDAQAVMDLLEDSIAQQFKQAERDPFTDLPSLVLFVGINGAGKTTTVGKLAAAYHDLGVRCLIGGADTFRAAAIEQLQVWGERAGVEVITRERGGDPASVCYDVLDQAEARGSELVLIDTAGRLHTSPELMRELAKVVKVSRKRANIPVTVVLVIDATTGQNGLNQAREFNDALDIDGLIVTKLDGTAKGGIAVGIAHELNLPIFRIGVGEGRDDLQTFNALEFCRALVGETEGMI